MIFMLRHVVQIDKDVIKINYYTDIKKVWKNIIYKPLEDLVRLKDITAYSKDL